MNRREFLKRVGASGLLLSAPAWSSKVAAAELTPVGQYFVFVHLSGGWDATEFCDPKGNRLRSQIAADLGLLSVKEPGSFINPFPESSIRLAKDVYAGSAKIDETMKYAPFPGTYNRTGSSGESDDMASNQGLTTRHIQKILSGDYQETPNGNNGEISRTLVAQSDVQFNWKVSKSVREIKENARRILEYSESLVIELNDITEQLVDRNLDNSFAIGRVSANFFVYDAFYSLYSDRLRVLNGVDNRTNSHSTGVQFADTGSMSAGYPDFSALYAAANGPERPLAWLTNGGGNNESAGLVARSSVTNTDIFEILADPTSDRAGNDNEAMTYAIRPYLDRAHAARKALQQGENLPLRKQLKNQLYSVGNQKSQFSDAAEVINFPEEGSLAAHLKASEGNSTIKRHCRVGAASFALGMGSSLQIDFRGFDTHANHDNSHHQRIRSAITGLHFLFQSLEAYQVTDQTTVIVGSDFGRTPWYNARQGKDHWTVTSYLVMGNGVTGGTVVNATNPLGEALLVNPSTLTPESGGTLMTAAHLHYGLRDFAGIADHQLALDFPIDSFKLPILG